MAAEETYTITIDVETDWGGRSGENRASLEGLDIILRWLKFYNIKALFFISTETMEDFSDDKLAGIKFLDRIKKDGHAIGSHGHFHIQYDSFQRILEDKRLSESILSAYNIDSFAFRAPKFNKISRHLSLPYSNPSNHISLLKMLWLGHKLKPTSILYLHPFDLIGGKEPPNLFCKLWYSRPKKALLLFESVLKNYKGVNKLK